MRAEPAELEKLNQLISAGKAKTRGGETVSDPVEEGLVPEGETVIYPIREDIPILLVQEAIPLES